MALLAGVAGEVYGALTTVGDAEGIEQLQKRVDTANQSVGSLLESLANLDGAAIDAADVEFFRQLPQFTDDIEVLAREAAFSLKEMTVGVSEAESKAHFKAMNEAQERASARGEDTQALQERLDKLNATQRAEEVLAKQQERDHQQQQRDKADELQSIDDVNAAIDEQVRKLEDAGRLGVLTDDDAKEADRLLTLLHQRKLTLIRREKQEKQKQLKDKEAEEKHLHKIRMDAEVALQVKREQNIQKLAGLWGQLLGQIAGGFDAMGNAMQQANAAAQSQIDAMAEQLGEDNELVQMLQGQDLDKKDVAAEVGKQRAEAKADELKGSGLSDRDVARQVEDARRRGFRDTVKGRATPEEVADGRDAAIKGKIDAAQGAGNLSKVTADSMKQLVDNMSSAFDKAANQKTAQGNAKGALTGQKPKPGQDPKLAKPPQTPESQEFQQSITQLGQGFQQGVGEVHNTIGQLLNHTGQLFTGFVNHESRLAQLEQAEISRQSSANAAAQRRRNQTNSFRQ